MRKNFCTSFLILSRISWKTWTKKGRTRCRI